MTKKNLYVYAISKSLLIGRFKWLDLVKFNLGQYDEDSLRGLILEVGLKYPKELNELCNDYPLAADRLEIKIEMSSDYQL